MPRILVDGVEYTVPQGVNLLHACLSLGLDLPYFCWHPALGSVGACRQCAVKQFRDEKDTHGRIVMACMTPATEGTRIAIRDPEAQEFRASVTEWLMVNHPHDCPICDEGGECHLQDMTVMTGHTYRRYRSTKRTFRNQDLGPCINHEMNRCIQCYRCVRFYREYAGGRDLDAFGLRNLVYFGRQEDGTLESEFSGNLVEVCPTGVFTDKTLKRHYTRPWDLQSAPSLCVHCGLGCNTFAAERYGELRRIRNRYHGEVNGYFLCDRGRFGYEFANAERRLRKPLLRRASGQAAESVGAPAALAALAGLLAEPSRVIGIGSPRASLEANFALRTLVGPERFHLGVAEEEGRLLALIREILQEGPAPAASLKEAEEADAVLVLGEDVTQTAPLLALALRQAVRQRAFTIAEGLKLPRWNDAAVRHAAQDARSPLFIASLCATRLDDIAAETCRAAPADIARLGFAVARELDAGAPPVPELPAPVRDLAGRIAAALGQASRPLVVSGTGCGNPAVIQAAANVARALRRKGLAARVAFAVPECNSLGLALMGGPGLGEAFEAVRAGRADTVLILENDLFRRRQAAAVLAFLQAARHVAIIDHLQHETTAQAEIALPAGTFAESDGTLVNNEGRAQRFYQALVPAGDIQESWRWLRDLLHALGRPEGGAWQTLDDVVGACAAALPALAGIRQVAPPAGFRLDGQRIPRQSPRYSGRTAMRANVSVHEPAPPEDPDSPLSFSMEGFPGEPPPALITHYWTPGWNSVQSLNRFQEEVGGPLRGGDPGVRLLAGGRNEALAYFTAVPPAFGRREGEWLVLPLPQLFGSEELSALAPAVAARAPRAALALHPEDAAALGLGADGVAELSLGGAAVRLPVATDPTLPRGTAGVPAGMPGLIGVALPAWSGIRKVTAP
jgi:NADH-quinone oxidoreductase subunit G